MLKNTIYFSYFHNMLVIDKNRTLHLCVWYPHVLGKSMQVRIQGIYNQEVKLHPRVVVEEKKRSKNTRSIHKDPRDRYVI